MAEMTKEAIVASCKANGGYAAPLLNDQLFLHCKGFVAIRNLETYTAAKVLWLEHNAINNLSGLEHQQELISLFLQNNTIYSLRSLTTPLRNLRVLNLSHNYLSSLAGLGNACPQLETLQASHNRISSLQVCEDLFLLADTLTSVDLSFNRISTDEAASETPEPLEETDDVPAGESHRNTIADEMRVVDAVDEAGTALTASDATSKTQALDYPLESAAPKDPLVIVNFFKHLPNVSVVYLQGNSISHGLKHYRRNMILHLPQLTHLDDRPVFPEERRAVEAWGRGGTDAENAERAAIREEKKQHLNSCVRILTDKMEANRELRNRLTRQWDAKRAEEMEQITQLRREQRDARATFECREQAQRESVEKEEQAARWDFEEACADATVLLSASEAQHRHAYEHAMAVQAVTDEAKQEIASALEESIADSSTPFSANTAVTFGDRPSGKEAIMAELMKSDDDILREMEGEIESVLNSLEPAMPSDHRHNSLRSFGAAGPAAARVAAPNSPINDRAAAAPAPRRTTTTKMERALHDAVDQVSAKLREDSAAPASAAGRGAGTHQDVWTLFDQWERRQKATSFA